MPTCAPRPGDCDPKPSGGGGGSVRVAARLCCAYAYAAVGLPTAPPATALGSPSAVATVAVAGEQGVGLFTVGDDQAVLFRSSAEYTGLTGVALSQTEPGLVLTTRDEGELFLFACRFVCVLTVLAFVCVCVCVLRGGVRGPVWLPGASTA